MDLDQLANLGEFIGGVAVVATLLYLVVQVRQTNSNSRASARQALVDNWSNTIGDLASSRERCRIAGEAIHHFPDLPEDEQAQFSLLVAKSIMNVYNGVLLYRQGMLDRETLDYFAGFIASAKGCEGFAVYWESFPFPRELMEYLEDFDRRHGRVPPMDEYWGYFIREWDSAAASAS